MADQESSGGANSFRFIGGGKDRESLEWPNGGEVARKALAESLNAKNVSFLLGAGCSSAWRDKAEVGIPTMAPLSKDFVAERDDDSKTYPTKAEREFLSKEFGIVLEADEFARNIERLMEVLFSLRFVLSKSNSAKKDAKLGVVNSLISKSLNHKDLQ